MIKKLLVILISVILIGIAVWRMAPAEEFVTIKSPTHMVMGTFTGTVVVAPSETEAQAGIKAALEVQKKIDRLMSYQRADSELSRINAEACDHPMVITPETMAVLGSPTYQPNHGWRL